MHSRVLIFLSLMISCNSDYTPKPKLYLKLELPNKAYQLYESNCAYTFLYPNYSYVEPLDSSCLINIVFPDFNGVLHITYLGLDGNLPNHIEQSRDLAYKHNIKADLISEQVYLNIEKNVYGMVYDYDGFTATAIQFYLTDSLNHFFRGALYFNTEINDSIIPINSFLKEDVKSLIESLSWKYK